MNKMKDKKVKEMYSALLCSSLLGHEIVWWGGSTVKTWANHSQASCCQWSSVGSSPWLWQSHFHMNDSNIKLQLSSNINVCIVCPLCGVPYQVASLCWSGFGKCRGGLWQLVSMWLLPAVLYCHNHFQQLCWTLHFFNMNPPCLLLSSHWSVIRPCSSFH